MNVIPQPVKDGFVRLVGPIARALVRSGVKPNVVTTLGTLVVLGAAAAFWRGAPHWEGALLFWIVVVLAVATTITVLQRVVHVARVSATATRVPTPRRDTLPGRAPQRKGS